MNEKRKYYLIKKLEEINKALKAIKDNVSSIPNVSKSLFDAQFSVIESIDLIKKDGDRYSGFSGINNSQETTDIQK